MTGAARDRLAAVLHARCEADWKKRHEVAITMHSVDAHHDLAAYLIAAGFGDTAALTAEVERLRTALEAEVRWLEQSNGLHEYERGGIHKMPGCQACGLLTRLRAALAGTPEGLRPDGLADQERGA